MTKFDKMNLIKAMPLMANNSKRLTEVKKDIKAEIGTGYVSVYNQLKHIKKSVRTINKKVTIKQSKLIIKANEYINRHNKVAEFECEVGDLCQIAGAYYAHVWDTDVMESNKPKSLNAIVNFSGKPMTAEIMEALCATIIRDGSIRIGDYEFEKSNIGELKYVDVNSEYDIMSILWEEIEQDGIELYGEWIKNNSKWELYLNFTDKTLIEEAKDTKLKEERKEELDKILKARYETKEEIYKQLGDNAMAIAFALMSQDKHLERIYEAYSIDKTWVETVNNADFGSFRKRILAKNHPDRNNGNNRGFLIAKADMNYLLSYMRKNHVGITIGSVRLSSLTDRM